MEKLLRGLRTHLLLGSWVLTLTFCSINISLQGPDDPELVVSKLPGLTPRDIRNYTLQS